MTRRALAPTLWGTAVSIARALRVGGVVFVVLFGLAGIGASLADEGAPEWVVRPLGWLGQLATLPAWATGIVIGRRNPIAFFLRDVQTLTVFGSCLVGWTAIAWAVLRVLDRRRATRKLMAGPSPRQGKE